MSSYVSRGTCNGGIALPRRRSHTRLVSYRAATSIVYGTGYEAGAYATILCSGMWNVRTQPRLGGTLRQWRYTAPVAIRLRLRGSATSVWQYCVQRYREFWGGATV